MILLAVYGLLAAWQLARWLYAVPILAFDAAAPAEALAASARMTRGRIAAIVTPLVLWRLLLTIATVAITWACRSVTDTALDWAGIDVHRVLPLVSLFLTVTVAGGLLYGGLPLAGHQFLVLRMFAEQRDPGKWRVPATPEAAEERSRVIARPGIVAVLALVGLALGLERAEGRPTIQGIITNGRLPDLLPPVLDTQTAGLRGSQNFSKLLAIMQTMAFETLALP